MPDPSYVELLRTGELEARIEGLSKVLESCELCPRKCRVNRLAGQKGFCRSGRELMVSSYGPHFGEEPELVGRSGSGTIFLTNCNLLCVYCQNYDISHLGYGQEVSIEKAATMMLHLQEMGCHNINFVTPTHYAPQLIEATGRAAQRGLRLPIVWNCGGYENIDIVRLLDGVVDIYMPDVKYSDPGPAQKYSHAPDYFERCKEAVREMHRQVGELKVDNRLIAYKGLLIRHLVLPEDLAGSQRVFQFIVEELSRETYVNIMDQYRPCGQADRYPSLGRRTSHAEYRAAVERAKSLGLHRGFR